MCSSGVSLRPGRVLLSTAGTEGRVVAHSPFVSGMVLLTPPREKPEMPILTFVCIFIY